MTRLCNRCIHGGTRLEINSLDFMVEACLGFLCFAFNAIKLDKFTFGSPSLYKHSCYLCRTQVLSFLLKLSEFVVNWIGFVALVVF